MGDTASRVKGLRQTADRQLREETQQQQRVLSRLGQEAEVAEEEPYHCRLQHSTLLQQDLQTANEDLDTGVMGSDGDEKEPTNFFHLPQEVRDMIYAYFPYLASIHINQDPAIVVQPAISKVCRRMREESLDVFYGRNNFFLDLRGWKSSLYDREWTPRMIFDHWITAIGNENAARLRSLSFFSHNFRVNIKVSNEKPPTLKLKFRTSLIKADLADGVPASYSFKLAARRAESGLQLLLDENQANMSEGGMTTGDYRAISNAIDTIQPFLCKRTNLAYQGAVLKHDNVPIDQWPSVERHQSKCDDCGYHRFTRAPSGDQVFN